MLHFPLVFTKIHNLTESAVSNIEGSLYFRRIRFFLIINFSVYLIPLRIHLLSNLSFSLPLPFLFLVVIVHRSISFICLYFFSVVFVLQLKLFFNSIVFVSGSSHIIGYLATTVSVVLCCFSFSK